MSDPMPISARLQRLIKSRGFSIAELARAAGKEKQQVWRIVRGINANPGIDTVRQLVEAMGATMAELFSDDLDSAGRPPGP